MNAAHVGERGNHGYWTVAEIADRWQCSERHVRRVIASGQLTVHKFGHLVRVSDADLRTYERINRAD